MGRGSDKENIYFCQKGKREKREQGRPNATRGVTKRKQRDGGSKKGDTCFPKEITNVRGVGRRKMRAAAAMCFSFCRVVIQGGRRCE